MTDGSGTRRQPTPEQCQGVFRAVFEQTAVGVAQVVSRTGAFLRINRRYAEILGYTVAEMENLTFQAITHPDDLAEDLANMQRLLAGEIREFSMEKRYHHKDGSIVWVNLTVSPMWAIGEEPDCHLAIVEDITLRKQGEQAVLEARDFAESLIQTANAMVVVLDTKGDIQVFNSAAERITGYSIEEISRKNWFETLVPRDRYPEVWREFERLTAGGIPKEFENPILTKGGEERHIVWKNSELIQDGRIAGTVSFGIDITDRKKAEKELAATKGTLEAAIARSPSGILIADAPSVTIRLANEAAFGIRASDPKVLTGIDVTTHSERWQTFRPDGSPYPSEELPLSRAVLRGEVTHGEEIIIRDERGNQHWVSANAAPIRNAEGQISAGIVVFHEITDRKQAERQREELIDRLEAQNAELERFTYTVSHDLKSPLITIKGYIGLLSEALEGVGPESVHGDLERISNAADKMGRLLEDLLELSRIGRLVNPPEDVPVAALVDDALTLLRGRLQEKRVEVEVEPDLPVLRGDRTRLLEIFQNLIDNSVKYMGPQPQPRIEIGARRSGNETVCYVGDNGIGIEPRFQEKVFGLFDQLDPKAEGTGIGLALVKRIVEIHGGRIWIESEGKGRGSTFCFVIPNSK